MAAPQHQPRDRSRRYVTRIPFDYNTKPLDRGQVMVLEGARNDEKLTRLGYLAPLDRGVELYQCAVCGAEFVGIRERTGHGDRRHAPPRLRTPDEEDAAAESEDRMLDQIAPLYLNKTAASGG